MNAEETVIKEEVVSDVECEKMDTEPVIKEEVCDVVRGKSDSEPVIKEEIVVSNVDGGNSDSEPIVKEEIVACDVKSEPVIEAEFVACDADWGKNSNINIKTEPSSSHEIDVLHVSTEEILKEELISDVEWEKSDSEPEIQTGPSSTHENVPKLSAGKRPYPCMECDYKAVSKSILICHMRSHTGERPFACQLCDYRGTQRTSLAVHMKTHTAAECKALWKNLKPLPIRSGSNDAMNFALPFVKTQVLPSSDNVPPVIHDLPQSQLEGDKEQQQSEKLPTLSSRSSSLPTPNPPTPNPPTPTTKTFVTKHKSATTDADQTLIEHRAAKRANLAVLRERDRDREAMRSFLLSLVPELESMTQDQLKQFRQKVFVLIDSINQSSPRSSDSSLCSPKVAIHVVVRTLQRYTEEEST